MNLIEHILACQGLDPQLREELLDQQGVTAAMRVHIQACFNTKGELLLQGVGTRPLHSACSFLVVAKNSAEDTPPAVMVNGPFRDPDEARQRARVLYAAREINAQCDEVLVLESDNGSLLPIPADEYQKPLVSVELGCQLLDGFIAQFRAAGVPIANKQEVENVIRDVLSNSVVTSTGIRPKVKPKAPGAS